MKKGLVIFLIISTFFLVFYLSKKDSSKSIHTEKALEISNECSIGDRTSCLTQEIISYISKSPENTGNISNAFSKLLKHKKISDDPELFLNMVHDIGMVLIENGVPLRDAMVYCGTAFRQGCIHGAVMEYIDNTFKDDINPAELFALCQANSTNALIYLNCVHGVGHELAAKEKSPIVEVVRLCDPLKNFEENSACASGVLMEYSKGTAGSGAHSDLPIGTLKLPCTKIDKAYQPVCRASAGSNKNIE